MDIRGDQSIATDTKITEEISAQQNILNEVIALSTNEISTLQTKLNDLTTFATDSEEYSLQSNYLAELSSYNEYFTQESAIVASASTLDQLQTVAANIKAFRDAGYNSEIYNMVTFTLLYYDAGIISTAENRLNSVGSDLDTLENQQLLSNTNPLDDEVSEAMILINKASSLHDQASGIILQALPGDSASTTPGLASDTASTSSVGGSTTTSATSTRALIEKSITDIKSAYKIFIDVSTNINAQLNF
jgi:limonene-1,2-epoxide hydrolase